MELLFFFYITTYYFLFFIARWILHSTNCDTNLLSYNNRELKMCIGERAKLQSEPYICDRLDDSLKKDVARCQWFQSILCNNNFLKEKIPSCEWIQSKNSNYCDKEYKVQDIASSKRAAGVR